MKTKIIATIGPSSLNSKIITHMCDEGMDIARINTKHGSEKQHLKILEDLKKIRRCKILIDIASINIPNHLLNIEYDYVALSFAERTSQIKKLRKNLPKKVKIIAKIETKKGIKNIDELIKISDGIMVARGDLGKNTPFEKIPLVQKIIIKKCIKKKRMSITATEMLMSIMDSESPERSEISDIANAVLDGSSALMLSEETAIGKNPVLSVKIMKKTIRATENGRHLLK